MLRAAAPDDALRSCEAARAAGLRAVELSGGADGEALIALATAHAECGEFDDAVARASDAMEVARRAGDERRVRQFTAQYELFRAGRKLRLRQ